mmetsp:Transcript_16302/g.29403  ORF Transcript_16302/g.29403 Transcript_16302/m.29403 type:complete len:116 (+) Transcript_16302:348-695(+)
MGGGNKCEGGVGAVGGRGGVRPPERPGTADAEAVMAEEEEEKGEKEREKGEREKEKKRERKREWKKIKKEKKKIKEDKSKEKRMRVKEKKIINMKPTKVQRIHRNPEHPNLDPKP